MASNITKFDVGVQLKPSTATLDTNGEMKLDQSSSALIGFAHGASGEVVLNPFPGSLTANGSLTVTGNLNVGGNESLTGTLSVTGTSNLTSVTSTAISAGNIAVSGNVIYSTNTNGNISLDPNGTGYVAAESELNLIEITTPANPATGRLKFYAKSDDLLYIKNSSGVETQLAAAVTSFPKIEALYRIVVGSTAQVAAGSASFSSMTAAIASATTGDRITMLPGTITENVTVNKQLDIEGLGYASIIAGTLTFTSAANFSSIEKLKVTNDVTLNLGTEGIVANIYLASGKTFVDNSAASTNNYVFAMQDT